MKPWKFWVAAGAACTACCALPFAGGAVVLAAGSTTLVAVGAALWACAGELAAAAFVLAVGLAGTVWWRRRRAARQDASCGCQKACNVSANRGGACG